MSKVLTFYIVLLFSFHTPRSTAGILINEVMVNEPGSNTSLEWIELWNYGNRSLSMEGMLLIDGDDSSEIYFDSLRPNEFVVLVRNETAFEYQWGNSSDIWGDSDAESYRISTATFGLQNGADTVELIDSDYNVVSAVGWSSSPDDGISIERVDPRTDDETSLWLQSLDSSGSTPGFVNSVTPSANDLEVKFGDVTASETDFVLYVQVLVSNVGLGLSDPCELILGLDDDRDGNLTAGEVIVERQIPPLEPESSIKSTEAIIVAPGIVRLIAEIDGDDNSANNRATIELRIGCDPIDVVISEFLANPYAPLESEWMELYNISETSVELTEWEICDAHDCFTLEGIWIEPGEYLLLAEDELSFRSYYGDIPAEVYEPDGWRPLNSTGDMLYLRNAAGLVADSTQYEWTFPDNISLERIDPYVEGCDPTNWYRSTDESGSTPGQLNSIAGGFTKEVRFELESRVISPDGDGIDDMIRIHHEVPRDVLVNGSVYDIVGRKVRVLFEDRYLSVGSYDFDGLDDSGSPLEIGMYIIVFTTAGAVGGSQKLVFAVVGQ